MFLRPKSAARVRPKAAQSPKSPTSPQAESTSPKEGKGWVSKVSGFFRKGGNKEEEEHQGQNEEEKEEEKEDSQEVEENTKSKSVYPAYFVGCPLTYFLAVL